MMKIRDTVSFHLSIWLTISSPFIVYYLTRPVPRRRCPMRLTLAYCWSMLKRSWQNWCFDQVIHPRELQMFGWVFIHIWPRRVKAGRNNWGEEKESARIKRWPPVAQRLRERGRERERERLLPLQKETLLRLREGRTRGWERGIRGIRDCSAMSWADIKRICPIQSGGSNFNWILLRQRQSACESPLWTAFSFRHSQYSGYSFNFATAVK